VNREEFFAQGGWGRYASESDKEAAWRVWQEFEQKLESRLPEYIQHLQSMPVDQAGEEAVSDYPTKDIPEIRTTPTWALDDALADVTALARKHGCAYIAVIDTPLPNLKRLQRYERGDFVGEFTAPLLTRNGLSYAIEHTYGAIEERLGRPVDLVPLCTWDDTKERAAIIDWKFVGRAANLTSAQRKRISNAHKRRMLGTVLLLAEDFSLNRIRKIARLLTFRVVGQRREP
jgi:hypothetical protein